MAGACLQKAPTWRDAHLRLILYICLTFVHCQFSSFLPAIMFISSAVIQNDLTNSLTTHASDLWKVSQEVCSFQVRTKAGTMVQLLSFSIC
jgi:hypothetical protein